MTIVCILEDCPAYRNPLKPMKVLAEKENAWVFRCGTCERLRAIPKSKIGGTMGAGESSKVPPKTLWAMGMTRGMGG